MGFPLSACENCSSIWSPGTEEHDWQVCSACGWRPGKPIDDANDDMDHPWYLDSDPTAAFNEPETDNTE